MGKQLFLRLKNSGELSAEGKASIELTNIATGSTTKLPLIYFSTLPGVISQIKIPLGNTLPSGRYNAVAMIDDGNQEMKIGQLQFTQINKNHN